MLTEDHEEESQRPLKLETPARYRGEPNDMSNPEEEKKSEVAEDEKLSATPLRMFQKQTEEEKQNQPETKKEVFPSKFPTFGKGVFGFSGKSQESTPEKKFAPFSFRKAEEPQKSEEKAEKKQEEATPPAKTGGLFNSLFKDTKQSNPFAKKEGEEPAKKSFSLFETTKAKTSPFTGGFIKEVKDDIPI